MRARSPSAWPALALLLSLAATAEAAPCDAGRRPIVYLHGGYEAGDSFAKQVQRFIENGTCEDRIFVLDYSSEGQQLHDDLIHAFILQTLRDTGADQVDLVAHSHGGWEAYNYLQDPAHRAVVARYAHLASRPASALPGPLDDPVPTLNVYSDGDFAVYAGDIPGAENHMFPGRDHLQIAYGPETFAAMFAFFYDAATQPIITEILPERHIELAGKAITFSENQPLEGACVRIFAVDPATGSRLRRAPDAEFRAAADGSWGPFDAAPATYYEFELVAKGPREQPVHTYREPFIRSDHLVYLRTIRKTNAIKPLHQMPDTAASAVHIVLSYGHAVEVDRDDLSVNGVSLSIPALAQPQDIMAMAFLWDDDNDGQSDSTPLGDFTKFELPFFRGMDLFIPPGSTVTTDLDGRVVSTPAVPSSEGYTVVVYN